MSDEDFVRRLRAMRDVPPWMMHLTFDAPLRVQRAHRESSIGSSTVDVLRQQRLHDAIMKITTRAEGRSDE